MGLRLFFLISISVAIVVADQGPADYSLLNSARTHPLQFGMNSSVVVALQNALSGLTFEVFPDGVFGLQTLKQVKAFQLHNGLPVDGIVGANTVDSFDSNYAITGCSTPGLSRLPQANVTQEITENALSLLKRFAAYPKGTEIPFATSDGGLYFGRVELHFHPWNGTMTPKGYHSGISVYYVNESARNWSATKFLAMTNELDYDQRESIILVQLAQKSVSFEWKEITSGPVTFRVSNDVLSVGFGNDTLRMPCAAFTAQKLANLYENSVLPTTLMTDLIWKQSDIKLTPKPLPPTNMMRSNKWFEQENELINDQLVGKDYTSSLIAGEKKTLVLTNLFLSHPSSVAIYGWYQPNGQPIQPLFLGHAAWYADYSHSVRLVQQKAFVNSTETTIQELLQSSTGYPFLSNEGPLKMTEIPFYPMPAPKCIKF